MQYSHFQLPFLVYSRLLHWEKKCSKLSWDFDVFRQYNCHLDVTHYGDWVPSEPCPDQPQVQRLLKALRLKCEVNHSLSCSTKVKNVWCFATMLPIQSQCGAYTREEYCFLHFLSQLWNIHRMYKNAVYTHTHYRLILCKYHNMKIIIRNEIENWLMPRLYKTCKY
jgi:hypothetical protein